MERVVGVRTATGSRAYRFATLRSAGVIYDRIGGEEVVLFWREGTRSALDTPLIADGRDIGSAGVFIPVVRGRILGPVSGSRRVPRPAEREHVVGAGGRNRRPDGGEAPRTPSST